MLNPNSSLAWILKKVVFTGSMPLRPKTNVRYHYHDFYQALEWPGSKESLLLPKNRPK